MTVPLGYRIERGFLWPVHDHGAAASVFQFASDLGLVYQFCPQYRVAVQAGGNCGIWPAAMARQFGTVYTFEPDPINFRCLCANAPQENIVKFNAALGDQHKRVSLNLNHMNVGAHHIMNGVPGRVPTLRVDDLALDNCDLIYLDIEGYEAHAIWGAVETIRRCRPVIGIEEKGLGARYGIAEGECERWLASEFQYEVAARPHRDVILVPR